MAATEGQRGEQDYVSLLSDTLAENLIYFYPKSSDCPCLDEWSKELLMYLQQHTSCRPQDPASTSNSSNQELVQRAVAKALDQWKNAITEGRSSTLDNKKPKQQATQSISLLDQWNAMSAGGLDSFVSLDQIQDASDPQERLKLFQKIQHVDDIIREWSGFSKALAEGLVTSQDANDFKAYVDLHETWFQQVKGSSASGEYRDIQQDLCDNLVSHLQQQQQQQHHNDNDEAIGKCIQTVHAMWMHMITAGSVRPEGRLNDIGRIMFQWTNSSSSSESLGLFETHLVKVDPYARWFMGWLIHLPPKDVLEILFKSDDADFKNIHPLACALKRCQNASSQYLDATKYSLLRYSLSLVYAVLVTFRVSLFPWDRVGLDGMSREEGILLLATLYARLLQESRHQNDPIMTGICTDALETILSGSQRDKVLHTTIIDKLATLFTGQSMPLFLQNIH